MFENTVACVGDNGMSIAPLDAPCVSLHIHVHNAIVAHAVAIYHEIMARALGLPRRRHGAQHAPTISYQHALVPPPLYAPWLLLTVRPL
jgi:hypothetical protein